MLSTKSLDEYDCQNKQYRTLNLYWYSGHKGEGKIVYSELVPGKMQPLIVAAALSQFSAAVADTFSAIGNMVELTHEHIKMKWGYLFVGFGAITLTWSADTLEILALASRAFAFYYMLQCFVAISVSKSTGHRVSVAIIAAALGFITVFAVPAG